MEIAGTGFYRFAWTMATMEEGEVFWDGTYRIARVDGRPAHRFDGG